jgi:hypothetical protein
MKQPLYPLRRPPQFLLTLTLWSIVALPVTACTIFVLTDTNRVLFCNNEDGPSGETRIWFVPAGPKHHGAVYLGYDNGWAQGGVNTEGLAFDWVAGYKETWEAEPNLPMIVRNERVLETCATVEEAIAFYRKHHELSFNYAKILVSDRTGALGHYRGQGREAAGGEVKPVPGIRLRSTHTRQDAGGLSRGRRGRRRQNPARLFAAGSVPDPVFQYLRFEVRRHLPISLPGA